MATYSQEVKRAEMANPFRVWILGAGFSRPLGGPLLPDLLSHHMRYEMELRYGAEAKANIDDYASQFMYSLYDRGGPNPRRQTRLPNLERVWGNAEEFLVWLDDAASNSASPAAIEFRSFLSREVDNLSQQPARAAEFGRVTPTRVWRMAKLLLAGETSVFIEGDDCKNEGWGPYIRWIGHLSQRDTLVSFNYDVVVEKACAAASTQSASGGNNVSVPTSPAEVVRPDRCAKLLKLHGSTNWVVPHSTSEKIHVVPPGLSPFSGPHDCERLIAIPGRSKRRVSDGILDCLWKYALQRITAANEIVIVGYGFPRSDNVAKMQLLEAIRAANSLHKIRIVLGKNNDDATRLEDLLRMVRRPGVTDIQVCRFWTEDLLSAWPAVPDE